MNFQTLSTVPRLLVEAPLKPLQGSRFQTTGFPDLGAATFDAPGNAGGSMLLVESAQSMANRLETVCWDEGSDDLAAPLHGLPFVRSKLANGATTNSILEAHRLNSPYIVKTDQFKNGIEQEIAFDGGKPFDRRHFASVLLKYDPNSLVHGIFLEKVGGVCRLPRMLSSFIEASEAREAPSGGVKFDRVSAGGDAAHGKAAEGFGHVPFHRDNEFTGNLTAYFNIDLELVRGLGLPEAAQRLLIGLSLFKIRHFLDRGLRLRTACDLTATDLKVTMPEGWDFPTRESLDTLMPGLIAEASPHFASPVVTEVEWSK